jgi:hypothetical protein
MSLETKLTAASTLEEYVAILKITLHKLETALCLLAHDEGLPQPFRVNFKDQNRLHSRVAELWIHGAEVWIREPEARHFSLPISGTLTGSDGRTIMMETLE